MKLFDDLKTLLQLAMPIRGDSHQQRLESFYGKQASHYDQFRKRLLHGREQLWQSIEIPDGGRWVDFGGGTGANVENIADKLDRLDRLDIVDLSPSLLQVADHRIQEAQWSNVFTHCCDVTRFSPDAEVDVVTFSYSLTMIPDWFAAIDNALKILKPGGTLAVVDFYVSRKYPAVSQRRHGSLTRSFWPTWFARDNVFLSVDHLPYLLSKFEPTQIQEHRGGLPFVPFVTVPYYLFIGRKSLRTASHDHLSKLPESACCHVGQSSADSLQCADVSFP